MEQHVDIMFGKEAVLEEVGWVWVRDSKHGGYKGCCDSVDYWEVAEEEYYRDDGDGTSRVLFRLFLLLFHHLERLGQKEVWNDLSLNEERKIVFIYQLTNGK